MVLLVNNFKGSSFMRMTINVVYSALRAQRMTWTCVLACVMCLCGTGCREMTVVASGFGEMITGRKEYGSMIQRSDAREEAGDGPLATEVEELSVEHECRFFISTAGLIRRADGGSAAAKRDLALYPYDHVPGLDPFRLRMLEEASAAGDPLAKRTLAMTMLPETKASGAYSSIEPANKLPVKLNSERGTSLMREAAEGGDAYAALCLAEHLEPANAEHWLGVGVTRWVEITSYDSDGDADYDATNSNLEYASQCGSKLRMLAPSRRDEFNIHFARLDSTRARVERNEERQREQWAREAERAEAARAQREQEMRELNAALRGKAAEIDAQNRQTMDNLVRQGYGGNGSTARTPSRDPEPGVNKTVIYEKDKEPKVIVHQEPSPNSTVIYEKGKEPRVETSAPSGSGGGLKPQTNTPGQKNGWDRTYFDNGRVQTEVYYVNGKKNGEFRRYDIRSLNEFRTPIHGHYFLLESGQYENDQKTGEWKQWATSAYLDKPYIEQSQWYSRGILNGTRTRWDSAYFCGGRVHKSLEEEYVDGKLSGERREYEYDCALKMEQIKRSTMYLYGKKNGPQIEYRGGVPHSTTNYIDGEKVGR
jgi:antitoxin component YwqK of YwqJK toxin-antitoxin module